MLRHMLDLLHIDRLLSIIKLISDMHALGIVATTSCLLWWLYKTAVLFLMTTGEAFASLWSLMSWSAQMLSLRWYFTECIPFVLVLLPSLQWRVIIKLDGCYIASNICDDDVHLHYRDVSRCHGEMTHFVTRSQSHLIGWCKYAFGQWVSKFFNSWFTLVHVSAAL